MRKATERTARLTGDSFWIPAGLGRVPATLSVATLSVLALVAVFLSGPRVTMTVQRADAATGSAQAAFTARTADGARKLVGRVPDCAADGTSGNRIQFYYAYFAGQRNRIKAARRNLITVIEQANAIVYRTSLRFGAGQSLRIVTDANCVPTVEAIELPAADADSFAATVRDFTLTAPDRKYVLFANTAHYCGLDTPDSGDRSGAADVSDTGPSWARIDLGCWTGAVTAYKIVHMLGYHSPDPAVCSHPATRVNTANSSFLYGSGPSSAAIPTMLAAAAHS